MRYNTERWFEDSGTPEKIEDCERLEVIKQAIKAIDNAQNFKATVIDVKVSNELPLCEIVQCEFLKDGGRCSCNGEKPCR
ncbi:hypothetical protein ES708_00715 [subsurface metagenome]